MFVAQSIDSEQCTAWGLPLGPLSFGRAHQKPNSSPSPIHAPGWTLPIFAPSRRFVRAGKGAPGSGGRALGAWPKEAPAASTVRLQDQQQHDILRLTEQHQKHGGSGATISAMGTIAARYKYQDDLLARDSSPSQCWRTIAAARDETSCTEAPLSSPVTSNPRPKTATVSTAFCPCTTACSFAAATSLRPRKTTAPLSAKSAQTPSLLY